jgi:hypothetical protein
MHYDYKVRKMNPTWGGYVCLSVPHIQAPKLSGFRLILVYQIFSAYFSQVMHFIFTWLCAVRRGKGTGHPTPFNSWLSTPRGGGMGCAICVFMSVCLRVHVCMWVCASGASTV